MTLFPEPARMPRVLSRMYSTPEYRATKARAPRWAAYRSRTSCDECFAEQHESPTLVRTRSYASVSRTMPGGKPLLLCGGHAALWRERDGGEGA